VPPQAAIKGAARELRDGIAQTSHDGIQRQKGAPAELDDYHLLGQREYGAARIVRSRSGVGG